MSTICLSGMVATRLERSDRRLAKRAGRAPDGWSRAGLVWPMLATRIRGHPRTVGPNPHLYVRVPFPPPSSLPTLPTTTSSIITGRIRLHRADVGDLDVIDMRARSTAHGARQRPANSCPGKTASGGGERGHSSRWPAVWRTARRPIMMADSPSVGFVVPASWTGSNMSGQRRRRRGR